MKNRTYRRVRVHQAGLFWFEFSIVAAILSVMAGSLLTGLMYYEELSEAAVVQLTVENVRSGLRYQIADRLIQGRTRDMGELLRANPLSWVERSPEGYVGNIRTSEVRFLPKASWFYDLDRAELGYVPRLRFHLSIASGEPSVLRWRVEALKSDVSWNVEGVRLVVATPYKWF